MGGLAARFDCAGKGRTVTFTANYFSPLPPAVDTRKDPILSLESVPSETAADPALAASPATVGSAAASVAADPLAAAQRPPPTAGRVLKFCTCAIYIGLWLMAISVRRYSPSMDASPAATVGYGIGAAIALAIPPAVVIGVLSLFKRLRTPRSRTRIAFGVGLALVATFVTVSAMGAYQRVQKDTAYAEIRHAGELMRTAMYAVDHPTGDVPDIDPTPKARGAYGQIERGVKLMLGQRLAQYRAYMKELDEVRLSELFIANRLARDRGLVESRLILEQSQRIVQKYSQQNQKLLADVPVIIRSLDLTEQQKNQMIEGALKSRATQRATLARNWDIERQTLAEFEKMINLLDDNRRSWRAEHDEIVFDQDALLTRFQAHQLTVRRLTDERTRLELQQFDNLTSDLR